ncbi:hypothetical protein BWK47_04370 [Synechocystis sp. CACIAM 05]|nr:hypothetical protein BWK47_04370 [Synechocystis sp. CACIAM 05]
MGEANRTFACLIYQKQSLGPLIILPRETRLFPGPVTIKNWLKSLLERLGFTIPVVRVVRIVPPKAIRAELFPFG